MADGTCLHLKPNADDIRNLDFAIDRFCTDFDLILVNRALRFDKLMAFCEFESEFGFIQMFIEMRDEKLHITDNVKIGVV